MRNIWAQRLLFLLLTLSALSGFELYNQTVRIYHVVSATIDLDVPVRIELYDTNRSTMRRVVRLLRREFLVQNPSDEASGEGTHRSEVVIAAAMLDRCADSIGGVVQRFSVQSRGIAVVHDAASPPGEIPVHLSHGSADCGMVVIRSGAARCLISKDGPVVVTGARASDLIESE